MEKIRVFIIAGIVFIIAVLVLMFIGAGVNKPQAKTCTPEGGSYVVYPGALPCCPGLAPVSCDKPDSNGNCNEGCVGTSVCTKCGDGTCGKGENRCNCPSDCGQVVGASCGTVTPGYNDACCADRNRDTAHPECVGKWKYRETGNPATECYWECGTGTSKSCEEYCGSDPLKKCPEFCKPALRLCVGHYEISGTYPDCTCEFECGTSGSTGIANPASKYCTDLGYKLEIRKDSSGAEYGVCVFTDGSECDEWAFFRGECGQKWQSQDCICPAIYAPVCGIDGKTYSSRCDADCLKVQVSHEGECNG